MRPSNPRSRTFGRGGERNFTSVGKYLSRPLPSAIPRVRAVGAVTEPHAIQRLLGALGLAAEPPPPTAPLAALR